MHSNLVIYALVALLAGGCATTHTVEAERASQWLPEAQADLLQNDATVITRDGSSVEGIISRLTVDSLWLLREDPPSVWQVPLQDVTLIKQPRETAGVIGGVLGGAIVGGLIGASIGASNVGTSDDYVPVLSEMGSSMSGGSVGILIGAPLGGVIVGLLT